MTNTFAHDVRRNLLTVFLERRVKLDSLGCSYLVEQGEKVNVGL